MRFFRLLASAALTAALVFSAAQAAAAEATWRPERPVNLIVAYKAGTGTDTGARLLAAAASKYLGQELKVINVTGSGGREGWTQFADAAPDGYTLAFVNLPTFTTLAQERDSAFRVDSIVPVCNHLTETEAVVVSAGSPWKDLKNLVSVAKIRKSVRTATNGNLASNHIAVQLLADSAGFPYKYISRESTADQINALRHKEVDFICVKTGDVDAALEGDKPELKLLGVFAEKRLAEFPDVPTLGELGYYGKWFGSMRTLALPRGTPREIIAFYEQAFRALLSDPEVVRAHKEAGLHIDFRSAAEVSKIVSEQEDMYRHLTAGMR